MDATDDHEPAADGVAGDAIQAGEVGPAIPVIWDGEVAIVVRKPAGLLTESAPTIDSLRQRLRVQFASRTRYLVTVHRLDRDVSGLVLVAMTKRSARLLAAQFAARKVEKSYRAVLAGRLSGSEFSGSEFWASEAGQGSEASQGSELSGAGTGQGSEVNRGLRWTDRIVKCEGEARVAIAGDGEPGKVAETRVEIERYDADRDVTLVRMFPETGRMHQLRIQASSRGFPIVGEPLYGPPRVKGASIGGGETGRIALHATSLGFFDPRSGKRVTVQDPEDPLAAMLGGHRFAQRSTSPKR